MPKWIISFNPLWLSAKRLIAVHLQQRGFKPSDGWRHCRHVIITMTSHSGWSTRCFSSLLVVLLLSVGAMDPVQCRDMTRPMTKRRVARMPGDILIGALFPVHRQPSLKTAYTRQCGEVFSLLFLFYLLWPIHTYDADATQPRCWVEFSCFVGMNWPLLFAVATAVLFSASLPGFFVLLLLW